jgi:anaerobic selenocysteine-containing dehydrogenase
MLVTVEDGRAVKVEGNPDHPFTRGTLCGKVSDYLDRVYSKDRILYPMRRVGAKGSGQFERISWDAALDEISDRFKQIINKYDAQAIMPCSYLGHEGLLNGLTVGDAFFNRLGATITERTFCISCTSTAYLMTYGPTHGTDPDTFKHSKYIILWGCNALSTNVHLWSFIQEARKNGAKLVSIDPVRTRTAKQSDWHIPIRPGTDGALALGLMYVIINENTADYADIVLPATTQVENLDLMFSWGHTYVTLNLPAIAPLGEAVPNTELFRRLASRMGFEDECFKLSDEQLALEVLDWSVPVMQGVDMELLKSQGYAKLKIDPVPHAAGNFPTPSGKCEFVSSMKVDSNFVLPAFRQGCEEYEPGAAIDPLPDYTPQRESAQSNPELAQRYPLNLLSAKPHQFINSCFANLPKHSKLQGEPRVIIHPEDAAKRGIENGQMVKVFNDRGAFQVPAIVNDMTCPGVVVAPLGYWRKLSCAGTINAATAASFTDMGHTAAVGDALVEITVAS